MIRLGQKVATQFVTFRNSLLTLDPSTPSDCPRTLVNRIHEFNNRANERAPFFDFSSIIFPNIRRNFPSSWSLHASSSIILREVVALGFDHDVYTYIHIYKYIHIYMLDEARRRVKKEKKKKIVGSLSDRSRTFCGCAHIARWRASRSP